MKHFYLLLTLFFMTIGSAQAQPVELRGRVHGTAGEGVSYCTVSLRSLPDSVLVTGVISDSTGYYRFEPLPAADYLMEFSHVAYEPHSLKLTASDCATEQTIIMKLRSTKIDDVVVSARFIERRPGEYTVTLKGNPLAEGRLLGEALELMPGVLKTGGSYTVNGRAVTKIYIDDREASASELETLSAEHIEKVEIQPRGGSDQNLSNRGAVLRIKLRPLKNGGYMGIVGDSFYIQFPDNVRNGLFSSVAMRYGKLNIFNNFCYTFADWTSDYHESADYSTTTPYRIDTYGQNKTFFHSIYDHLSLVYELTSRHSIGVAGKINFIPETPWAHANNVQYNAQDPTPIMSRYRSETEKKYLTWSGLLYYKYQLDDQGSHLMAYVRYTQTNNRTDNIYLTEPETGMANTRYERLRPFDDDFFSQLYVDKNFSDRLSLKAGGEYYHYLSRSENFQRYDNPSAPESRSLFRYRGDGMALFADLGWIPGRFSLLAGARLQWDWVSHFTLGDDRWRKVDYLRVAPNISLEYTFDKNRISSVELFYTYGDGGVLYSQLSPIKIWQDEFHYWVGNPDLRPNRAHILGTTLNLKNRWTIYYYLWQSSGNYLSIRQIDPDDPKVTFTRPENGLWAITHMLSASYAAPITQWWRMNSSISGNYTHYRYYDNHTVSKRLSFNFHNSFQLGKGFGMNFNFFGYTPQNDVAGWRRGNLGITLLLRKWFMDKRLSVSLTGLGMFFRNTNESWDIDRTYYYRYRLLSNQPQFQLEISYSFNNYKSKKGIQQIDSLLDRDTKK